MRNLERKLTLPTIIAISIAGMLGSGIFVLPGIAAAKTGESIWLAYLCAAICIIPAVFSKSELATAMPKSGGAYVYIERAFGPLFGTISGIGLWLSLLLKSSFALVGFGAYLMIVIQTEDINIKSISISFLIIIMLLNISGVKKVGKVQLFIVLISLLGLISILILGVPKTATSIEGNFLLNGNIGLISTIAFVYISYAGVTKIAAIAGEVKNPNRNLPLAMILSLIIISIIYVSIAYILVNNVPLDQLETDYKPIHTLSEILGGEWFAYTIACIGIITLISMANSGVLASSRFPFAMANDKLLPNKLTILHPKYLTPINTIILTCVIMAIVIMFLDVEKIAKLASAFKVFMFISVNCCIIILRETSVQWYKPTYKSPLYPYIQLFGIISGIILLFYLGWMPIIALITISILGSVIYFVYGKKASRSGVLINYGHLPALFFLLKKGYDSRKSRAINVPTKEEYYRNIEPSVAVALLGDEKTPEILSEIGISLIKNGNVEVINITEVPDQTELNALEKTTPHIKSLQRQIEYLSNKHKNKLTFRPIATHNVSQLIEDVSIEPKLEWFVLEWNGRSYNGILINNPLGWIINNIQSNFALFKDNGIKYFSKIVLAIRPNSQHLEDLISTSYNISRFYNAELTLLQVLPEAYSTIEKEKDRLRSNKDLYSKINSVRIEVSNNPIECISNITAEYDLLILGTPKKDTWKSMLFGTGKDLFALEANCSVLRLTIQDSQPS